MTYLQFLFVFIVPPIVLLAAKRPWGAAGPRSLRYLLLIAVIAFLYATPWDNYLVWRGVWGYETDRVIGTIGYVPVEEYVFFILQPLMTGLWLYRLMGRHVPAPALPRESRDRLIGTALYLLIAVAGAVFLRSREGTYLGLILVWAAPVLAAQWAYAGNQIIAHRRAAALGILVPTIYLWVADAIAIRLGIWGIADRYTYGIEPFGLPVEEATFFLVTNILVVQGLILFIAPPRRTHA